jgi:hypothetical protein
MATATKTKPGAAEMNGNRTHKVTLEEIPVEELIRIEAVQRPLTDAWVRTLAREMDLDALGTFTASRREDGRLVLLNGGHRQAALFEIGMPDWPVRCEVYHDLTLAQEAGLFRRLNRNKKASAIEDFLKGVTEGDPECTVINRICKRAGLKVDRQVGPGLITCVASLRKVYNGRGSKVHPDELKRTLEIATRAWGHTPEAVEGQIVHGFGEFIKRYSADVDDDDLTKKLSKYKGGPSRLLSNAGGLHDMSNRPTYKCLAELVLNTYNKGRRKNVLPSL